MKMLSQHNGKLLKNLLFSKIKKNMGKEVKKIEGKKIVKKKLINVDTIIYKNTSHAPTCNTRR
jgi:hypothetical protein